MFFSGRCPFRLQLVIIITLVIATETVAFSFDSDNLILYEDAVESNSSDPSFFGYSLALWSSGTNSSAKSYIFIGAPKANSSKYPEATEPGTVFKCEIGKKCMEWSFEYENQDHRKPGNGSWLGGSIFIGKQTADANIVVCGPRWLDGISDKDYFRMTGICYHCAAELDKPILNKSVIHCISSNSVTNQFGFSVYFADDLARKNYSIGTPGFNKGRGSLIVLESQFNEHTSFSRFKPEVEESSYLGYAVTAGDYFHDGVRAYATGAPRSRDLQGSVYLVTRGLKGPISGEQFGEYYGYALASCDVNGDGTDELLVGAPLWTKDVDEGRVYVLKGRRDLTFEVARRLDGKTPRGRFGSAITCLGDVDFDGYEDVAIGAPYAGNGSVFIYRGSRSGLSSKPSQEIAAPDSTIGFGISISEPRDVDHNGYADIAVGAYLSGHVALIRSKGVVVTEVTLESDIRHIMRKSYPFEFTIAVCSSFKGAYVTKNLTVKNVLKVDEVHRRAKVVISEKNKHGHTFSQTLKKSVANCTRFKINVTKNDHIRQAIKISVIQSLEKNTTDGILRIGKDKPLGRDNFWQDCVVIDPLRSKIRADHDVTLAAIKCGNDNHTCKPKLEIILTSVDNFIIDSSPSLTLNVTVKNTGEPAYHTKATIRIPISITVFDSVGCTDRTVTDNYTEIRCEIANPLETNAVKNVSIYLDLSTIRQDTNRLDFTAEATTESEDISKETNTTHSIACRVETDVGISRKSTMDTIGFDRTDQVENLPNKSFEHTYLVRNYGRTLITKVVLGVSVPTHWIHADKEIEVVRISEIRGELDRNQLFCENEIGDEDTDASATFNATMITEWLDEEAPSTNTKFSVIDGKVYSSYPENRTIYINSTNPSFRWTTRKCVIAPFQSTESVAEVTFAFELMLSKFPPEVIQAKDIIFFVTNGSIAISSPNVQTVNNASDAMMIGTVLTGNQIEHHVAMWILALAVFFSLLLLILIILGLLRFGFFNRSKKIELEALLQQQTVKPAGNAPTVGSTRNATAESFAME